MSSIFVPFRAIGVCSNGVPLSLSSQGKNSWVATAVGKTFHVYECNKLHLVSVGQLQSEDINCLVQNNFHTYAAVGGHIVIFKRGKQLATIDSGRVHIMTLLGKQLISVDDRNSLKVWDIKSGDIYVDISLSETEFKITALVHPSTYLNKLLLGSEQGQLQLWNIRTSHLVYTFSGWDSSVLSLSQSTALDVVGVGLASGCVLLHNIRRDETLMKFYQDWGPVTSLSFRTDGVDTMVTGSNCGHIAVWDLNERRLCSVLRNAHSDCVGGMEFFPQQPLLISNSNDNSIKIWIFDQSDGSGRLLKERCGHSAPPTLIRFHPTIPRAVISAGSDQSLRIVILHRQTVSRELSQGSILKKKYRSILESRKLPIIIDFACESHHQNEWDSLVTVHQATPTSYTWNVMNYSLGKHCVKSKYANSKNALPKCCCISGCGNFMILGMSSGDVEIFNMQSGLRRGELRHKESSAHTGTVRGIASSLQYTVTGGADRFIKVWSFQNRKFLRSVKLDSPINRLVFHRESGLLGVACDNYKIEVIDVETCRVVRTFTGHFGKITDMCFSYDSRWLISSSMDCTIRTWDTPTGHMIDIFTCETPATSMTLSLTGDFLATSHIDELGIYLWSNKTLYTTVSLKPLPTDTVPNPIQLPTTVGDTVLYDSTGTDSNIAVTNGGTGPLTNGLLTLSDVPKSQWHSLQYIDIIKERNKPKEPVQPVKPAPFFLPTQPGLDIKFLPLPDTILKVEESAHSKLLDHFRASTFQQSLTEYSQTKNFSNLIDTMKGMGPAAIDLEFQLLVSENDKDITSLSVLIDFLLEGLQSRNNFELIQSYIGLVLKYHTSVLSTRTELLPLVKQLLNEHQIVWKELMTQFNFCSTIVSYCKSATV